ncbi:MAG: DUF4105 domain-containing protein [Spirochaetaceae bacterium]|nr:DUF4105 domain-containing protein [Spirochaetaceae bacterium]
MKKSLLVFLLFACAAAAGAQNYGELVFKLAVFGPSDKIFVWWGHAALIVEDTQTKSARVFDWGIFSYPSDNFLWDFVHDRVKYRCRVGPCDLSEYFGEDRDIVTYTLNFDADGKRAVLEYAENTVLPENCYYEYHQFRNNCSTGIRDIIDRGTGGQLKAWASSAPGRLNFRNHARRFSWHSPAADWLLNFLMGQSLDGPGTVWDQMFLPVEIARAISDFRFTGHSGDSRKLVTAAEVLNTTKTRHPVLQAPRGLFVPSLAAGLLGAGLFACIAGFRKKFPRAGRIAWGITQSLAGLAAGAAGSLLFFGRFFLNNDYIRENWNLLFVNPLLLAVFPLGIIAACRAPRKDGSAFAEKCLRVLWTCVFAACLFTIIMKALPWFYQENLDAQALVLPVACAVSLVPRALSRLREKLPPRFS